MTTKKRIPQNAGVVFMYLILVAFLIPLGLMMYLLVRTNSKHTVNTNLFIKNHLSGEGYNQFAIEKVRAGGAGPTVWTDGSSTSIDADESDRKADIRIRHEGFP